MERSVLWILRCLMITWLMHKVAAGTCELTWLPYNDQCFKYFDDKVVHSAVKANCESRRASVMWALTPKLKDFLLLHSRESENSSYWCDTLTGDIAPEMLQSTTTSPIAITSRPTSVGTTVKSGTGCYFIQNKALQEADCNELRGFICEKDAVSPPATCPQGTHKVSTDCFWVGEELLDQKKASEMCSRDGGQLANLQTKKKKAYGIASVVANRKNYWVGARRQEGKVKWNSGESLESQEESPFVTVTDEDGSCVILGLTNASRSGTTWILGQCNRTAHALCEKKAVLTPLTTMATTTSLPPPSCPGSSANDRERDGICYWETTYETPRFDWTTARKYCQSYGGDLASYKDAAEEKLALGSARGHEGGLWIGLRRTPGTNAFRWSDGSTLVYTNWAPGQPKTVGSKGLCVAHTGTNSTWEVTHCGISRYFVCKIPRATVPASAASPTKPPDIECARDRISSLTPWSYFRGYCYAFYSMRRYPWTTAKLFCEDNGAFLASTHSDDEISFYLQAPTYSYYSKGFWIGLRAKGLHSSYRWDDGSVVDYVNWDPSDSYDESSNSETCVSFNISTGFWEKKHCNELLYFICKAKNGTTHTFTTPVPTPALEGYCHDDWYTYGNKCYRPFGSTDVETWSGANTKCTDIGAQLVTIHNKDEQDFLVMLVAHIGQDTWIGMFSEVGGHLFHWIDNSSITFTNWDEYEPNFSDNEEKCVHMAFKHRYLGRWNDIICTRRFAYICQVPKDPMLIVPGRDPFNCPGLDGGIKLQKSCYKIVNDVENLLTWRQAQTFCLSLKGNLASIRNLGVTELLRRRLAGMNGVFWIGMRSTKTDNFRWIGNPDFSPDYSNWLPGQPRAVSDLQNCVAMDTDGKWMVRYCDESHPFICQEAEEIPTVAPPEPNMVCPNSSELWKDFGGNFCYIIKYNRDVTSFEAAYLCFQQGGYLASFHSSNENEAVLHRIKNYKMPVHIGFRQKADGTFGWLDGSAVDYVNWAPEEPNDFSEMCVEMHTDIGTWNDVKCNEKRGYICSTLKVPSSNPHTAALEDRKNDLQLRVSAGGIVGITVCVIVVLVIAGVACYYFCPYTSMRVRRQSERSSTI